MHTPTFAGRHKYHIKHIAKPVRTKVFKNRFNETDLREMSQKFVKHLISNIDFKSKVAIFEFNIPVGLLVQTWGRRPRH